MDTSKLVVRTCVGCREKDSPANLLRIVLIEESSSKNDSQVTKVATAVWDPAKTAVGRGAWVHEIEKCLKLAISKGGIRRSFRKPVETSQLAAENSLISQ